MAWLIRLAGLRDLRRDDGLSDVSSTVLGDGMSENYIQKAVREYWEEKPDWEKSITGMSRDHLDMGAVKFKRPVVTHEAKLNLLRNELAYYHSKEREARRQAESVLRDLLEIRRTAPSVDMMAESALRRA